MRRGMLAFWTGVVLAYLILTLAASSSTVDVDLVPGEANGIVMAERVDQGPLSRVLNPGAATLGTLRLTKRTWGFATTYGQELGVSAARLAQQAGTQISLKVTLAVPGAIVGTNATGRDGGALVWTEIPADAPLWVRTRAINWPVVVVAAAAIAATVWVQRR
jgi:hypothetical protein